MKSTDPQIGELHTLQGARVVRLFRNIGNWHVLELPAGRDVLEARDDYRASGRVLAAEANYYGSVQSCLNATTQVPDDPLFTNQIYLHQTGGNPDIDAPEGWNLRNSTDVLVAVIDSGVDIYHEDLQANLVDSLGWNFIDGNTNVLDDANHQHGTLVAGIIGADADNGLGVSGVAWSVGIVPLKIQAETNKLTPERVAAALDWAIEAGCEVINASFRHEYSNLVLDAVRAARNHGIVVAASAGNQQRDNDENAVVEKFPASHDLDNILSVVGTTGAGEFWIQGSNGSNRGLVSCDLGAQASSVYTTHTTNQFFSEKYYWTGPLSLGFEVDNGTSFSTPQVSGTLALMKRHFLGESYIEIIHRLFRGTTPLTALEGKCQTGGLLNLNCALDGPTGPVPPFNDDFADAFEIANPNDEGSITATGSNLNATEQSGEATHAGVGGGGSIWWKWTAPSSDPVWITTAGSNFDTVLAIYTSLTGTAVVSDDNSGPGATSLVTFTPTANTDYYIAVDGRTISGEPDIGTAKLTVSDVSISVPTDLRFVVNGGYPVRSRATDEFTVRIEGPASATVVLERSLDDRLVSWEVHETVILNGSGIATKTLSSTAPFRVWRARIGTTQFGRNTVGYVDLDFDSSEQRLVGNPFVTADNSVAGLFPSVEDGTVIYKWNGTGYDQTTYASFLGGWSDPAMTMHPGEGVVFDSASGSGDELAIAGEILEGYSIVESSSGLRCHAPTVPVAGPVRRRLDLPVSAGDTVTIWIGGSAVAHEYQGGGVWWDSSDQLVSEPEIGIGEAFFIDHGNDFDWFRNFGIWE